MGAITRLMVIGCRVEDVRAADAGVRGLGLAVDWHEPADAPDAPDPTGLVAILLDLDAGGLERADRLRQAPETRDTVLLFAADASAGAGLRSRALALSPGDILTRPLNAEVVRARAQLILHLRRPTEAAGGPRASRSAGAATESGFRSIAEAVLVPIWRALPGLGRTWANRAWFDWTGLFPDAGFGFGWSAALHPDDRAAALTAVTAGLAGGRPFDVEYRLRRPDGTYRSVLDRGGPLGGDGGFVGVTVDTTDKAEAEAALRDADRRRDDYLAMLAHELRNPLGPLRNGLHILARRPGDAELVAETRAMMGRQVENMARIVDDLLDVARVARGKVTLRPARIDLADVAKTNTDDRRAVAAGARVSLVFAAPTGPVWVNGDVTRLSQALDNLIHNAVKFTPAGGSVTVTVAAEGDAAVVRVRDTGLGIDSTTLPHLFEVFTQADRSLDRSRGGLGLGLPLVKGLVQMHGGTVDVHSDGPGRGSEFTLHLPRSTEPAALTEIPTSPSGIGRRRRVLVVEDNPDSAASLRTLLDLTGYEVEVAATGPDGVATAACFRPHAVVCDIGLPGLDGYGVARALRANPETAKARLIAVTGYGRAEDVEQARRAGFDRHLTKPVDPQELLDELVFPAQAVPQ
jgi:signal transduction histidine kinase/DNA-binding response OmpR family regulator